MKYKELSAEQKETYEALWTIKDLHQEYLSGFAEGRCGLAAVEHLANKFEIDLGRYYLGESLFVESDEDWESLYQESYELDTCEVGR